MRFSMRIAVGILLVSGVAFSMPARNSDDSQDPDAPVKSKPGKLSHLFMFHKNSRKETEAKSESPEKADTRRHTNGFPEGDKKGAKYQPQTTNQGWVDDAWKTNRNKDTFKQIDAK